MTNPSHFINKTLQNIAFIHHVDKSQLQLGDSSFAFRTYHASYTLKDFRTNSGASFQILKHCRRQEPSSPAPQMRDGFAMIKMQPQRHLQLHCMGNFNTFHAKPTNTASLCLDTNSQLHHITVILLKTATSHPAPPGSYKVSASPGNTLSTSGD